MKKKIFFLLLLFIQGCTESCQKKNTAEKELIIGTNANFPPFESIDDKGSLVGFDIDFGRSLAKYLDKKAVFKEFDFDALILALQKGQIDIILSGMSITSSRQEAIAMVPYQGEPLTKISFLFWQHLPKINNLAELKIYIEKQKSQVSVQAGHFLEDFLTNEKISTKPLIGPPEQILDLKYKKSIAAALDTTSAKNLAQKHEHLEVITLELPKDKWDLGYGVGIKKSREDLINRIKDAINNMKSDGTLDALKSKWLNNGN